MIRLSILALFAGLTCTATAQFMEFGGGLGAMHYTGDLNSYPRPAKSNIAGTAIYRFNLSEIVSFKTAFTIGSVSGDDLDPRDALAVARQHSFKHGIMEVSGSFEYHFLNYRANNDMRDRWAPYALLGVGLARVSNVPRTYEDFSPIQFVLPMGGGVKYLLSKRLTLAAEFVARKTFFDYLDGISDGDQGIKANYRFGNPNDDDWYFYSGLSLTYVLYEIPCPFPYIPNRAILTRIRANRR